MQQLQDVVITSGVGFGTSGARGLVSALTPAVCQSYAQAFLWSVQTQFRFKQVAVAIDLRPSSPEIALYIVQTITAMGFEPIFCGAIPTPALALFAQSQAMPAIMVTGSHIPFDRNGLKFYRPDGEISKADEAAMLACPVQALAFTLNALPEVNAHAQKAYIQRYVDVLGVHALLGMRLAIYQHSSVGRDLMVTLFEQLGAEVICLERSNTFVPIDTEAVSAEDRARGEQWAQQYQVDAIISTDGDGDRPLISDEHGHWLRGDIVGLLTAKALGIQHLAVPVSCNTAIEMSGLFNKVVRTRIGSPYVIAAMQTLIEEGEHNVAGFEANGGFLLASHLTGSAEFLTGSNSLAALPTRDAVLPVVALLWQIKTTCQPLSQLVSALPQRFTASDRLQDFPTEKSKALLSTWSQNPQLLLEQLALSEFIQHIDETDGLRLSMKSGRIIHLRPSGNAPEFRCYVETEEQSNLNKYLRHIVGRLSELI